MLSRESVLRFVRFGAVGVTVMGFFMALNAVLGRFWGPQAAFFAAYPPALLLHYLLNKHWTFRDATATDGRKVADYLHTVVVTFLIQWPVFTVALHGLGLPSWLAAGGANLAQMAASFLLMQLRVFRPSTETAGTAEAWHRLGAVLLVAAVSVLIVWTALGRWAFPAIGPAQGDYYNLLVHGFEKGSLAMDLAVPERLKEIAVPWDPTQRPKDLWVPADVSYANGKFYLYFGVVPVVVLFWPFKALTGADLPFAYGLCVFALGAFWVLAALWLRILRDHFPRAGGLAKLGGVAVLGLAGGLLILARRANFWELPIASGQFFLAVMVTCAYRALGAARPLGWLAGAGAALGLAVGSRPTLAVAGVALAVTVLVLTARVWRGAGWPAARRLFVRAVLAGGLPLGVIMAGLLAYNHARFGSATEFGLNYQLTSVHEAKAQHFSLRFAPFNAGAYFWRAPEVERYFPFLQPPVQPPVPARYYTAEYVFGLLWICPVLWFVLAWWRQGRGAAVAPLGGVLAAVAGPATAVLLCFNTAVSRYTADFLPWWLLLALLGYVLAEAARPTFWRRGLFAAAVVVSGLAGFLTSAGLHDVLRNRNPEGFAALARLFNAPVGWWDGRSGLPAGPVEMEVYFSIRPRAGREPLLVTGRTPERSAVLWVEHGEDDRVKFIYEAGGVPLESEAVVAERGRAHRVRVSFGALFPPREHPAFAGWSDLETAWWKDWVRVKLDDRVLIDAYSPGVDVTPGSVRAGVDRRAFRDQSFSGVVDHVRRTGLPARVEAGGLGGDFRLALKLPGTGPVWGPPFAVPANEVGRPHPLLSAGRPGNADVLAVSLSDEDHFRLRYESWGANLWESPVWPVPAGRNLDLRVRLGSILAIAEDSPLAVLKSTLAVWSDGQPLWWLRTGQPLAPPVTVYPVRNGVESTSAAGLFRGRVGAVERRPAPPAWRAGPMDWIKLTVAGRGAGADPVVATGVAGAANTLAIEWLADGQARLVYDHWGYGAYRSEAFGFDESAHEFEVTLPALTALDAGQGVAPKPGRLCVKLDGRVVWETEVPYHFAASGTVWVAQNKAGASVASPAYPGVVLDIVQGPVREEAGP